MIGQPSVRKVDAFDKASGAEKYVADLQLKQYCHGAFIRSDRAHAKVLAINYPAMPDGYHYVDHRDISGNNQVHIVLDDMPIFAGGIVKYIGDPIALIVGPDIEVVRSIVEQTKIDYEDMPAIIDPADAVEKHFEYAINKGDFAKVLAEADDIYEQTFVTGLQEQAYLETQGMIAYYENDIVTVRGSLQCPYYVERAVMQALNLPAERVQIIQDTMGGAFGGKEDYPSILGCQVAVATYKTGLPIRVVFERREDIIATSKKHPSKSHYRATIKDGKVTGVSVEIRYDGGAYSTLSSVVLQRGLISSTGVYTFDNLAIHGDVAVTNTVPNGAFRGFGAPQVFFAIEMFMNHLADHLKIDRLEFKRSYLSKQGDRTSTNGIYHFPVPIGPMMDEVAQKSDYYNKKKLYSQPQTGRYRRGIEMSHYFHGGGFTGNGEIEIIKAVAKVKKYADDRVEILAANTDMGQGVFTTFRKIVGQELGIPYDQIIYNYPDTLKVPDSGPTVASRSIMIVGELIRQAALQLKENWQAGVEQVFEARFKPADYIIPFDIENFQGDAYPSFSYGVVACEVEVDTLTGMHNLLGVYGTFDVGTPIDHNIVLGQLEGGVMQGIGHSYMEEMHIDSKGRIRNNSFSDYLLPTSLDAPMLDLSTYVEPYPEGPFGAKGCGELPVVGVAAAYIGALETCVGRNINEMPMTVERTLAYLKGEV